MDNNHYEEGRSRSKYCRSRRKDRSHSSERKKHGKVKSSKHDHGDKMHNQHDSTSNKKETLRPDGYGLQRPASTSSSTAPHASSKNCLGPDEDLLLQKRKEREAMRKQNVSRSNRTRTMTAKEKEEALQSMRSHASARDLDLQIAIDTKCRDDNNNCEAYSITKKMWDEKANFLNDMSRRVHGID